MEDHVKRIHPDMEGAEAFYNSLKKTMSQDWWEKNKPCQEPDPIYDGMPIAEIEAEKRPRIAHVGPTRQKVTTIPQTSRQCSVCGKWIVENLLSEHISSHMINQPLKKGEVHCPECGLNIPLDQLSKHVHMIHPNYPADALKKFFKDCQASHSSKKYVQPAHRTSFRMQTEVTPAAEETIPDLRTPSSSTPFTSSRAADIFCPFCGSSLSASYFFAHLVGSHSGLMNTRFGKEWISTDQLDQLFSGYSTPINCPICHDRMDHLDFYGHASAHHANAFLIEN